MVQFDGLTLARTGTHSDLFGKRCVILFGLLFDYYRERPRKPCGARLPRFSHKMPQISAIPTKPFCRNGSRLDGLITPTLKAAGSNPVGRTKKFPAKGQVFVKQC